MFTWSIVTLPDRMFIIHWDFFSFENVIAFKYLGVKFTNGHRSLFQDYNKCVIDKAEKYYTENRITDTGNSISTVNDSFLLDGTIVKNTSRTHGLFCFNY